jgi:signal transduction histidine kinase
VIVDDENGRRHACILTAVSSRDYRDSPEISLTDRGIIPAMRAGYASVGRYATIVVAPLAVAYGLVAVGVASRHGASTTYAGLSTGAAAAELTAGWALAAAGLAMWWRRPGASAGPIAVLGAFAWFSPDWIGWQTGPGGVRVLALAAQGLTFAAVVQLALGAPTGWPASAPARRLIVATWSATIAIAIGRVLFYNPFTDPACVTWCTTNPLLVAGSQTVARALDWAELGLCAAVALAVAGLGARLLVKATAAARRTLSPVFLPAALFIGAWTVRVIVVDATPGEDPARPILTACFAARAVGLASMSVGLAWSLARAARGAIMLRRLAREVAAGAGEGSLEAALGRATGDVSLRLAFPMREGGRWIDAEGSEIDPPQSGVELSVTPILRDGQTVATLLHHPAILDGEALRREIGTAAELAIDNERLRAEALVQLRELKASRLRLVEAGDAERRALERDLHDGAQQRLVSLSIALRMAQGAFDEQGATAAGASLREAGTGLQRAIDELRELAHGIHPIELSDEGLAAAVEALADGAPLTIGALPLERLPPSVEAAAYVLVDEVVRRALTRDEGPAPRIHAQVADGALVVEVEDPGEPSPQRALADLVSVADRVRALDGRLTVEARTDGGVLMRAELPCA